MKTLFKIIATFALLMGSILKAQDFIGLEMTEIYNHLSGDSNKEIYIDDSVKNSVMLTVTYKSEQMRVTNNFDSKNKCIMTTIIPITQFNYNRFVNYFNKYATKLKDGEWYYRRGDYILKVFTWDIDDSGVPVFSITEFDKK